MKDRFDLSDLLVELRRELQEAQEKARAENLKFKVEDVELELRVGASEKGEGSTGAKFWVWNAEIKGTVASEAMHTIRLKMKPSMPEGNGDLEVSRKRKK